MASTQTTEKTQIDEGLYSRQLYAIGKEAMTKMINSNILISGISGLGVEIAKNTILQGCNRLTLHDTAQITNDDFSTNYYITESDINKNRAEATYPKLAELNSYVKVDTHTRTLTCDFLKNYSVVVLVDYSLEDQIEYNEYCHQHHIYFISTTTRGLVGQVFCDFGENFTVNDTDGEQPHISLVESITNEKDPLVTTVESKSHGLTSGNFITFTDLGGMTELNNTKPIEIKYVDKNSFRLLNTDTTNYNKFTTGGDVVQVKVSQTMHFQSMKNSLQSPEFVMTDFTDFEKPQKFHAIFKNLEHIDDYSRFKSNVKESFSEIQDDLIDKFYYTYQGRLVPMNSIFGGMVAQEILKACSGKFTPIYQWLYFDAFDCLPENYKELTRLTEKQSRYDLQMKVFGKELQDKILNMKYFIVGSGAIGCELLKNFAMIGVGCGKDGKIYLTDMDTIEKSNLNRQFLFRNKDIGHAKSEAAANAVRQMNPDIHIESHLNKVGLETENVYNLDFFNSLSGVANALDNIQARLYVDRRCVLFKKSLLESGTLGTKGNIQVIVPHVTESYGSSQDPPEASIPVCTVKTFPNELSHCIQFSREQFEDLFTQKPNNAQDYLLHPEKVKTMPSSEAITYIQDVKFVLENSPKTFDDCIKFAFNQWYENYYHQIDLLIKKFPADSKTSTGSPFWSGAKKCPHVIEFDKDNQLHINFITAVANIWANIFGITSEYKTDCEYISKVTTTLTKPKYEVDHEKVKISLTDEEEKQRREEEMKAYDINEMINSLPTSDKFKTVTLHPQDFEKDADTNFHIDFITASSNMRASNYDIKQGDRHQIKGIAGRIIPALATTTSVVAGLVMLEFYKLAQGFKKIEQYRNTFINLALPYFGFSEPMKAPKTTINNRDYTMWDTFVIQGDMTLQEFIDKFDKDHKLEIETVTYGNAMIYGLMLPPRKLNKRLSMKIKDIITDELETKINSNSITLQVYTPIEDDENEDVNNELPEVLYLLE